MKKKFLHSLKIFFILSKNSFRATVDHQKTLIFFILGKIFRFLFFFLLLFLVFKKNPFINQYNFSQAIIIYLTFNFIDTLAQTLYREVYRFRPLLISGDLDLILIRPYNTLIRVLLGGLDFTDLGFLIFYFFILIFFLIKYQFGFLNLFLYFFLLGNAMILATAFHIFVLAFGILFTTIDHTIMIYRDITSFGRFPFDIYRKGLRDFLTFVLPIGIMFSFPPKALFGLLSFENIIIAFLISLISLFLSLKIWYFSLKKYQSGGS